MALREMAPRLHRAVLHDARPLALQLSHQVRRSVSSDATSNLVSSSFAAPVASDEVVKAFDPVAQSKKRTTQLPPSRYQFRSPKYYRGPFHPHQPPPSSDPSSREFIPGPFTLPRLHQTYDSTIAPDIMALTYTHLPPGYETPEKTARLRKWEGESPYFKGRPLRGPRGGDNLRLLTRPTTFRNIPKIKGIVVHTMAQGASSDSASLHVAGMALQAITNSRVTTHKARISVVQWGLRAGRYVSMTATLTGESMYDFLGKTVELVMPRIKDWKGISRSTGDRSGNISFGLTSEAVALYPEIEINYDAYPPHLIPGCHVTIQTTATDDRMGQLLMTSLGLPFYGKQK